MVAEQIAPIAPSCDLDPALLPADFISPGQARAFIPGPRPGLSTVWRWMQSGVERNGQRVRLRSIRCGRRLLTHPVWVREFVAALTALDNEARAVDAAPTQPPAPTTRPEGRRQRDVERARRDLAAAGI